MIRIALASMLLAATVGCRSAGEPRCQGVPGDGGIDFECESAADAEWEDRALEEAAEGMDRRAPGSRP